MFTIEDYRNSDIPLTRQNERWLYVRFPDIPEILTGGSTIEEAIQNAKEAFACHMEALQKQGKEIPIPTLKKPMPEVNLNMFLLSTLALAK